MLPPQWTQFIAAYLRGLPNAAFLRCMRQLEAWCDLPAPEAIAALQAQKEDAPRFLYQNLTVLHFKIQRELGIPVGPEAPAQMQQLFADVAAGRGSALQNRLVAQLGVLWQLSAALLQLDPTVKQPAPENPAKAELQQATTAIFSRLTSRPLDPPGTARPETIRELESILADFKTLAGQASPDNPALPDVFYGMGHTSLALAKVLVIAGQNDAAQDHFKNSATYFTSAGQPEKAAACLVELRNFQRRLSGSLDDTAAENLQALLEPDAKADPFDRIGSLINLANVAANAFDVFEARQHAEAAALELGRLGYSDPQTGGGEPAVASWIATATALFTGVPLLGQLNRVATWYLAILSARFADLIRNDRPAADQVQALMLAVEKALHAIQAEAVRAATEEEHALQGYFPAQPTPEKPPGSESGADNSTDRQRAIDAVVESARERCNQRIGTDASMDDLLAELKAIEPEGDALGIPAYAAKTRLGRIYILTHLGRAAEIVPLAAEARKLLLAGREPRLGSLPQSFERTMYLDSLQREVEAHLMLGEFAAGLDTCEEVIRDFEIERYRVNSPYRQSALLATVGVFYKWAVFFAFKLKRWDRMLEAIELIKARSAIRSRLQSPPDLAPGSTVKLAAEFAAVTTALAGDPANAGLGERRRQLWDLLSILRAQEGSLAALPEFTLASLQAALATDEALIGYFWLGESTVLAVAVDHERFLAERINFQPEELAGLNDFVGFVRSLKSTAGRAMDRAVARLGALLLPECLRTFIGSKARLILSPHRSLHLFPFHAAHWEAGEFIATRFAVRYVPNFSSLLLPWQNRSAGRVLALAIENFADPAVPPLHQVEGDATAIAEVYRAVGTHVDVLVGKNATRAQFDQLRRSGELAQFGCIHFGTHGLSVFEAQNEPMEAKLLLQDGALDCMDIAGLRLNAELAVVSACNSGQRALDVRNLGELPGDDIFGLQSALFQSGVRCVLGTLWLVETESSSAITRAFHRQRALNQPGEVALQNALKEYLADPSTQKGVFYWAPYFLSCLGASAARTSAPVASGA